MCAATQEAILHVSSVPGMFSIQSSLVETQSLAQDQACRHSRVVLQCHTLTLVLQGRLSTKTRRRHESLVNRLDRPAIGSASVLHSGTSDRTCRAGHRSSRKKSSSTGASSHERDCSHCPACHAGFMKGLFIVPYIGGAGPIVLSGCIPHWHRHAPLAYWMASNATHAVPLLE